MTEMLLESSISKKKVGVDGVNGDSSESRDSSKCTNQLCTDVVDTSHIFPDLCDECKKSGVVGDWMEKEPGLKLQVFRSWRSKHRETIQAAPEESQQWNGSNVDKAIEDDCENLKLEGLTTSSISNGTTTTSTGPSPHSNARSIASSDTSISTAPSLHGLKARVQRLRARTDQLIAKIRVQRAASTIKDKDDEN